jgi:hypothetical protein
VLVIGHGKTHHGKRRDGDGFHKEERRYRREENEEK